MTIRISAIVVVDSERRLVRGQDGFPGQSPKERRRVKKLVSGHAVLVGKATYEKMALGNFSLPKGTLLVVLTSDRKFKAPGCAVVRSIGEAGLFLRSRKGIKEIFVIGGNSVYRQLWKHFDRLYLTVTSDKAIFDQPLFPEYDGDFPKVTKKKKEKNGTFFVLERK
ncbi:MAG: dihydrofolate reductase [Candidatus Moranbacteria bacterium]|nr:dihydrofolate reductase [Candidatus Moranbacteria bacterium]